MTDLALTSDRFVSFTVLRGRHYSLLQSDPHVSEIVDFVARARETGRILANSTERDGAQAILNYWSAELVRQRVTAEIGLLREFDPALATPLEDSLCPYVGLRAFEEGESVSFFGRQASADRILRILQEHRLAIISGISGSGKSSVVRAGVLPLVKEKQLFQSVTTLVPGSDPLRSLTEAIVSLGIDVTAEGLPEEFLHGSCLDRILSRHHSRTLVVVDQFEEIFTLAADRPDVQKAFVRNLIDLADSDNGNAVVFTVRGEYEFYFFKVEDLERRLESCRVRLDPLTATELRDAVVCPAGRIGLEFEEGLVEELVRQVVGEPAGLPLLQFTLRELWRSREGNRITWDAYRKVGVPRDALMRTAENVYTTFTEPDRRILKNVFMRLVRPGESGEIVNNRERLKTVLTVGVAEQVQRVVDRLVDAGLLRLTSRGSPEDSQLEVAHEALIRNWPRLVEWVETDRNRLRARLRLTTAATAWHASGRDPGGLLAGKLLEEAETYTDLTELERDFVHKSQEAQERLKAEEEAARQRELEHARNLATEQERRAEDNARAAKRMKTAAILLAFVTAVALGTSVLAGFKSRVALLQKAKLAESARLAVQQQAELTAKEQAIRTQNALRDQELARLRAEWLREQLNATEKLRAESISRELAFEARTTVDTNPELSLLLAREAANATSKRKEGLVPQARTALHLTLQAPTPLKILQRAGTFLDINRSRVASTDSDGVITLWDSPSLKPVTKLVVVPPSFLVRAIAIDESSTRLFLVGQQEAVTINLLKKQIEFRYPFDGPGPISINGRVGVLAIGGTRPRIVDAATGKLIQTLSRTMDSDRHFVVNLTLSPSGKMVAACYDDQSVRIYNISTGSEIGHFNVNFGSTSFRPALAISPDDNFVAAQGTNNTVELHSLNGDSSPKHFDGVNGIVSTLVFSRDGKYLAAANNEAITKIWDMHTGRINSIFPNAAGNVHAMSFEENAQRLFTTTRSGTITVWNLGPKGEFNPFSLGDSNIEAVASNSNGSVIATIVNHQLRIWSEESIQSRPAPGLFIKRVALSADGKHAAAIGYDQKLTVVDLIRGESTATFPLHQLAGHEFEDPHDGALALSREGKLLAVGSAKGVQIWNVTAQRVWGRAFAPPFAGEEVGTLAFSANGQYLAISSITHDVIAVDVTSGRESRFIAPSIILGSDNNLKAQPGVGREKHDDLAFSADGQLLAAATPDNSIAIWDVTTEKLRRLLPGQSYPVVSIAISPNHKYLAAAYGDGIVRTWRIGDGLDLFSLGLHDSSNVAVVFANDDTLRVVDGNLVQSYSMHDAPLLQLVDTRITRPFTREECEAFSIGSQHCQALNLIARGERAASVGQIQASVNAFRKAKVLDHELSIDPEQRSKEIAATFLIARGRKLAAAGSVDKAVSDFTEALRLKPGLHIEPNRDASRILGQALEQQGDNMASEGHVDEAVSEYKRARPLLEDTSFDPERRAGEIAAHAFYRDSLWAAGAGDHNRALADLRRVHELDPSLVNDPEQKLRDLEAQDLVSKAWFLAQHGKIDESIGVINAAKEMSASVDHDAALWNTLCWFGALRGDAKKVLFACDKAVSLQPQNGNIVDSRAVARARSGDRNGAAEDFRRVLALPFGDSKFKQTRQDWLTKIEQGIDPFTPEVINKLLPTNLGETPD